MSNQMKKNNIIVKGIQSVILNYISHHINDNQASYIKDITPNIDVNIKIREKNNGI